MFCIKCGKEIVEGAQFCIACGARVCMLETPKAEKPIVEKAFEPKIQPTNKESVITLAAHAAVKPAVVDTEAKSYGRGGAITSFVFGIVSYILGILSILFGAMAFGAAAIFVLFGIPAFVFSIIGVIKGAKSVGAFKEMGKQNRPRPVLTLVFGIVGLVLSATALLVFSVFLLAMFVSVIFGLAML